ncbi:MAG: response regulator [Nitrospirota bacterium]
MTSSDSKVTFPHTPELPTILVVENDPILRTLLKSILEPAGYFCQEARDGMEALALVQQHPATDLILSDFQMPRMDGLRLLQTLQDNPKTRGIPFILLTENSSFSLRRQALRDGALAVFYKPYTPPELLHILNRSISHLAKSSVLSVNSVMEKTLS